LDDRLRRGFTPANAWNEKSSFFPEALDPLEG